MSTTELNYNKFTPFSIGLRGNVLQTVINSEGKMIVAGSFTSTITGYSNSKTLNRIAIFDGYEWFPLGDGFNNTVTSLVIDGSDNIYAGGSFTASGTTTMKYIAKWNGTEWSQVGPGLNALVTCLTLSSSGYLVAGGSFTQTGDSSIHINCIGMWNGNVWSNFGPGPSVPLVGLLSVHNLKYYLDNLYVVGNFTKMGETVVNHIAMWNNSSWFPVGDGFNQEVRAIEFDNTGKLYVGGRFKTSMDGTKTFNCIAVWNGSSWSSLNNGIDCSVITDIKYIINRNLLYVIQQEFGITDYAFLWNGTSWMKDNNYGFYIGNGTKFIYDFSGELNTSQEYTYDVGLNNRVTKLRINKDGDLILAGLFTTTNGGYGSMLLNRIARWSFSKKKLYNCGPGVNNDVFALAVSSDDRIVVGGRLTSSNSGVYDGISYNAVLMNRIGMWDGIRWNNLGSGFNDIVFTVVFDKQGNLYAGGWFTQLGDGTPMKYISKWNGTSWIQVGGGLIGSGVYTMEIDQYDNLIVGGLFTTVGDGSVSYPYLTVNGLAGWNGTSWFRFKTSSPTQTDDYGFNNAVLTIDFDRNGNMAVGGGFTNNSLNRVAKFNVGSDRSWSDSTCSSFGLGLNGTVEVIKYSADGYLYAGGTFTSILRKFNGTNWIICDDGLNGGGVYSITRNLTNDIIIGGTYQASNDNKRMINITQILSKKLINPTLSNFSIPSKNVDSSPFTIIPPTSNSNGSFTYTSSNTSIASISGNTITINNVGQVTITATQTETIYYNSGTISSVLVIDKLIPTINSFNIPNKMIGSPSFTLSNPTTNSNGIFSFSSSNTSVATISGNIVTIVGVGSTLITAILSETTIYTSASSVSTFTVDKTSTILTNFLISNKVINDVPFAINPPSSNRPGNYIYTSSNNLVATVSGSIITITGAGSVTITAVQTETELYELGSITATFIVSKLIPTIPSFIIKDKALGDPSFTLLNPTTNSNGTFSFSSSNTSVATISGNTVNIVGDGTVTIITTVSETSLYVEKSIYTTFNVYSPINVTSNVALETLMTSTTPFTLSINSSIKIPTPGESTLQTTSQKKLVSKSTKPISLTAKKI
jgi:hypothetical protein